jgi:hypothetical protein
MPDLFDFDSSPHARRGDPATSHEAVPKNLPAQALRVLRGYRSGDAILDHDAYRRIGLAHSGWTHQRCSDLRKRGLIERVEVDGVYLRGKTPSGKAGYLCRITKAGRDYLAQADWGKL